MFLIRWLFLLFFGLLLLPTNLHFAAILFFSKWQNKNYEGDGDFVNLLYINYFLSVFGLVALVTYTEAGEGIVNMLMLCLNLPGLLTTTVLFDSGFEASESFWANAFHLIRFFFWYSIAMFFSTAYSVCFLAEKEGVSTQEFTGR